MLLVPVSVEQHGAAKRSVHDHVRKHNSSRYDRYQRDGYVASICPMMNFVLPHIQRLCTQQQQQLQ